MQGIFHKRQKRSRPVKQSGPSGWDIGKLPILMINHFFFFVNRRFWRKNTSFGETGRVGRKTYAFVIF